MHRCVEAAFRQVRVCHASNDTNFKVVEAIKVRGIRKEDYCG